MDKLIKGIYSFSFKLFGITISSNDMGGTITSLLDVNNLFSNNFTLYSYVATVHNLMVPVGLSLLTLFFLINIIKMSQEGVERITWERVVLKAAVFFMLVFFINNSLTWFTTIANVVQNNILTPVENSMSISSYSLNIADELIKIAKSAGTIQKYIYEIVFVLLAIPYMATIIMILSQVFLRAVKLLIYMMFSPIPIAFAAEGEVYRGKAISFFLQFAGVCFEAVVIYIGTFIYTKGLSTLSTNMGSSSGGTSGWFGFIIAILFMNGLFSAIIQLSSQLSERFFGRG